LHTPALQSSVAKLIGRSVLGTRFYNRLATWRKNRFNVDVR